MKFAFISTMQGSPWGGSEDLWSQAATQPKRAGHDVLASVMYWPHPSDKLSVLSQHDVGLKTYPSFRVGPGRRMWDRFSLSYRRHYRRLRLFKPDLVVISQGDIASGSEWAKVCRDAAIPYVIILHCNSELWWLDELDAADAILRYTNARRVFCVSRGNLRLLRRQDG